ncbi:MAG: thioredoxin family protein [Bacteroidota bacterium]
MKILWGLAAFFLFSSFTGWETNFDKAMRSAKAENKFVLLNFSGSDWCGPCIKLHKDFFENESFRTYADKQLILINADFPRQKKNQISKELQQQNDHLADSYNANGSFPLTVLLGQDGKVIKAWEGVPKESVEEFIDEMKSILSEKR